MSAPDPTGLGEGLKRAADAASPRPVDVDAVLAASRSRRRARRTAMVAGAGAVAVVLAVGGLVFGLQQTGGGSTTADAPVVSGSAESSDAVPEAARGEDAASGLMLVAPESVNLCGAPVATATDAATSPLAVTVAPPAAPLAPDGTGSVEVTVTNTGVEPVTGDLSVVPAITLAQTGDAVWHSSGTSDAGMAPIALAPGASLTLPAEVTAQRCTTADDQGAGLPGDLPPLEPGDYAVGAILVFTSAADGASMLLVSPFAPLTVE
ncbi:hypothetical protein [Agromyces sp. Soil535]|uniref:hypothetical protein n=1 Tax=Agromyces sp. Soil535 TaxID=1736390 RepID=UPI0007011BCD|nr:hypothetical protein [Agromyces sp. Soil535]KRE26116.1 hypothetical protein ASG80_04745 [Agromyces sp. Soil535]